MDEKEIALYFFRKLVYVLYLEVGALQPRVHPELAGKARLNSAFFEREKERQAAALYHQVENETDPARIVGPFEERTGLQLDDVRRVFEEGDWRNKFGGYTSGGPRFARIAAAAVELRRLIEQEQWAVTAGLIFEIKGLKTNQGFLVNQFERSERRR
jgi:hypothetical protein